MASKRFVVPLLALVFGCSAQPVRMPSLESRPLPATGSVPFELSLEFHSEVPDPYYVTSGPVESYARYPVSDQFRALLQRQAAEMTTAGSSRRATLDVRLTGLTTRYQRIGAAPYPPARGGVRFSGLARGPSVVPASFAFLSEGDGADLDIPEELHKGATLTATFELRGDGIAAVQRTVTTDHDDVILFWDFDPRDAYSYTLVLDRTLRDAVAEITTLVQTHLLPEGTSPPADPGTER